MLVMTMTVVARVVEVMLTGSSVSTPLAKSSQWLAVDAGDDHDGSGEGCRGNAGIRLVCLDTAGKVKSVARC